MRIAQVSTLAARVRQDAYGSVEALIWLLTKELARLGHEVTVFGVAGSEADGEVVATLPGPYGENDSPDDWHLCEWINLCEAVKQSGRFDLLHSHAYLWGLPLEPVSQAPMVHTMHIVPEEDSIVIRDISAACVTAWGKGNRTLGLSANQQIPTKDVQNSINVDESGGARLKTDIAAVDLIR